MIRRRLLVAGALAGVTGAVHAGVFIGGDTTSLPTAIIVHPDGYLGSSTTAVTNTVCFNPAVLPTGVSSRTTVDNAIKKAVTTWNAGRYGQNNYATSNTDITSGYYDFESAVLHEIGHCIGLGHPTIATGVSGGTANATASRPDAGNSYDTNAGSDGIHGSKDDSRGDNTNIYWYYPNTNDPLAYPSIIDTTTFTQSIGSLPSGSTWPANANSNVTAALGYSNTRAVMTWDISSQQARRRPTAEDMSTLKLAMAGRDGIAGNSDDYGLTLVYDSSATSCDIPISFSTSTTSLGVCNASVGALTSTHYYLGALSVQFKSSVNWFFAQDDNTTTTITSDTPDPSTVNSAYTVAVSVARDSSAMTGTPSGSVLVSDGSASCTATLSSGAGSCSLTSTSVGSKTLTATYLGYQGFDNSSATASHTVSLPSATIAVSDTPDPTNPGVGYTVSFTASGSFGTPTGTVTVSDGSASCGPITLVSGAGSCTLTSTTAGSKTLTATYSGNASYSVSTGTTSHTVNKLTPTITVTDTPDPSTSGSNYTVGVTVSGTYSTPSGTITVQTSDNRGCSFNLSSGSGSCSIGNAGRGTITIDVEYGGNSVYNSGFTSVSHTAKDASTTTITGDSPDASTVGQAYTVAFTVANTTSAATTPTGSVTVSDGSASCSGTLSSGSGSCSLTSSTVGSKTLTASYGGDTNVGTSSGTTTHTVNKGTPTVTVTDATDPSITGSSYTMNFTVAKSGGATPTGSVTVSDGTDSCSGSLSSGSGSCSLTSSTAGSKTLTASYGGDSNYNTASGTTTHTVSKAMPTVNLNDNPDSSAVGDAYTVTSSVSRSGGATATGAVTISDGSASCSITLSSGSGSCSLTSTTAGSKTLSASYGGDGNYSTSSATLSPHVVTKTTPTVTVTDATDPTAIGEAYTVNVNVAKSGGATATGSVTVSDGSATCSISSLSSGSGSCSLTSTTGGSKTLTASYGGDSNYNSTSGTTSHTVNKATPTVTIGTDTPDPSTVGGEFTVPFTVSGSAGTPSGTVTVSDGSATCSATLSSGSGSCNLTSSTAGSKTLTVSYGGDSNYNSASATTAHTVNKGTPTVTVSDATDPTDAGSSYTVNVSVTMTGGATPTGTFNISDGVNTCGATLSSGSGSCLMNSGIAGSKTLTATYAGDANYNAASGSTTHTVDKATPSVAITSDTPDPSTMGAGYTVAVSVAGNPPTFPSGSVTISDGSASCTVTLSSGSGSCLLTSTTVGSKTLTATYSGDSNYNSASDTEPHDVGKSTPLFSAISDTPDPSILGTSYTVAFTLHSDVGTPGGTVSVSDGSVSCEATLSGASGSCSLVSTSAGNKTLNLSYSGDSNYVAVSGSTSHTVDKAEALLSILSHDPNPSVIGENYMVSVEVAGGGVAPTGTVQIDDGTVSCTATLLSGSGACTIASTSAGDKALTANYSGDSNYTSASVSAMHQVSKAIPVLTLSDAPDPSSLGSAYAVSFELAGNAVAAPTGSVTVGDGTTECSATLSDGAGTCQLTGSSAGTITLNASYSGDENFEAAIATAEHTVTAATPVVTITSHSPNPSALGADYIVAFTVTGPGPVPTGPVSVSDGASSCMAELQAGGGSCTLNSQTAGTKTLTTSYAGDGDYGPASASVSHMVERATPSFWIGSIDPETSELGADYRVRVHAQGATVFPSGTVNISDGSDSCSATLVDGEGSCDLTGSALGDIVVTATYAGDDNYLEAGASGTHTVARATPTVSIVSHTPNPSAVLESFAVTVYVSGNIGVPTGTVEIYDDDPSSDGVAHCTATLTNGNASCALASTIGGNRPLRAEFSGDAAYAATIATTDHTVTPIALAGFVIDSDDPDPSTLGQSYTVSLVLSRRAGADPVFGNATASDGTNSCTASIFFGNGNCQLPSTARGSHTLTATYHGSNTYLEATATATHTVTGDSTITTIASHTPDPTPLGDSYTVAVTVSSGTGTPTGTVSISDGVGHSCSATLSNGSGACDLSTAGVPTGTVTLSASYGGSVTHEPSAATTSHGIAKGTPTLSFDVLAPTAIGGALQIGATVSGGGSVPTGTVQFALDGQSCNATLSSGHGVCSITTTAVGTRTISASYGGDANYNGATADTTHTIAKSTPTLSFGTVSPAAARIGESYSVLVTVNSGMQIPTGTIVVGDGSTQCTITLSGSNSGSCSLSSATAGTKTLTATYSGDAVHNDASANRSYTVAKATPTITIVSHTPEPSQLGSAISVSVTVVGSGITPGGSVTISDGGASCTLTLSGGAGSCALTPSSHGTLTLNANYVGDANYEAGSASTSHTVVAGLSVFGNGFE